MESSLLVMSELVMSDPRFFRRYLDIVTEAPTAAAPAAPAATPAPTQQQLDNLNKNLTTATTNIDKAGANFNAGNNVSGAVNVAKAANAGMNAAGMTFGDKVGAAGTAIKAGGRAGLEYLKSGDPSRAAAVAGASVAKDMVAPVNKIVNDPKFSQDFKAGVTAAKGNPNADLATQQMAADAEAGKISADSLKGSVNRISNRAQAVLDDPGQADKMMGLQGDDSPYFQHSGLTTANTAELDTMKKQAVQGTLKPVEYTPAPINNNPQQAAAKPAPTAPQPPVKEDGDDDLQKLKEFLSKRY
jgi:hypothetical protein